MSDLDEKLQPPRRSGDAVARQTLGQLRRRWGLRGFAGVPEFLEVSVAHSPGLERWKRTGGAGGESTIYELQRGAS